MTIRFPLPVLSLLTIALLSGCGLTDKFSNGGFDVQKNPDVYHIGDHRWQGDTIVIHAYRTSAPSEAMSDKTLQVECRSCNLVIKPFDVAFDNAGNGRVYIPEARSLVSTRLRLRGKGIDTTIIHKQRSPHEATAYYSLPSPLSGRVLINQFAVLYSDTAQDSVIASANLGDELNIYPVASDRSLFYRVHHPNFREPLYLLKENAVQLY
jgi:hypothetical protein